MFAAWYQLGLLAEMGWPRKQGLMRREVVSALAADTAATGLLHMGMAAGAFDVPLACSLVRELFSRDSHTPWSEVHETLREQYTQGREPLVDTFGSEGDDPSQVMVAADLLRDNLYQSVLAFDFAAAAWHGVTDRDDALVLLNGKVASHSETAREMVAAGLEMDTGALPSSAEDYCSALVDLVRRYEAERRPLPEPPSDLLALAYSVREA